LACREIDCPGKGVKREEKRKECNIEAVTMRQCQCVAAVMQYYLTMINLIHMELVQWLMIALVQHWPTPIHKFVG
jgi:hypothetical protein